jgi:hypothetical protein
MQRALLFRSNVARTGKQHCATPHIAPQRLFDLVFAHASAGPVDAQQSASFAAPRCALNAGPRDRGLRPLPGRGSDFNSGAAALRTNAFRCRPIAT